MPNILRNKFWFLQWIYFYFEFLEYMFCTCFCSFSFVWQVPDVWYQASVKIFDSCNEISGAAHFYKKKKSFIFFPLFSDNSSQLYKTYSLLLFCFLCDDFLTISSWFKPNNLYFWRTTQNIKIINKKRTKRYIIVSEKCL